MGKLMGFLLAGLAWGFYLQPRKLQLFWGNRLGDVARLLGFRAAVIRQNLNYAFPHDEPKRLELFTEAYRHFGNLVLEVLLVFGPLDRFVRRYVDVQGQENWLNALALGKGVIFLSSHVGNWEVMAATAGVIVEHDLCLVTKHLKPQWLHQAVEQGRARCRVSATYEPRTFRDVLKWLKEGKTVGFVLDQYAGPPIGVRVPVFGIPVGTSNAVAAVAKRTGAAVVPVMNYRTPDGRWVVHVKPPIAWKVSTDAPYELAENTARFAAALEADIRFRPEQWLWTHRRFKGDLSELREGEWSQGRTRS